MDMTPTAEQEAFKKGAREFLEQECPKLMVRTMEDDEKEYSPHLWQRMARWDGWV